MERTLNKVEQLLHASFSINISWHCVALPVLRLLEDALRKLIEKCLSVKRHRQPGVAALLLSVKVWVGMVQPQIVPSINEVLDHPVLHRQGAS